MEANLDETNLSGADLSGANLSKAFISTDLSGAKLLKANLAGADLSGSNLSGMKLSGLDFSDADLSSADLSGADLTYSDLSRAKLLKANFNGADLNQADLSRADLTHSDLSGAKLNKAVLNRASLLRADLRGADLSEADLAGVTLVEANLENADLTGCRVYGISTWNLKLKNTKQTNLVITRGGESIITVDNIEVAQFIYLLLNNEKVRQIIDAVTSKVVLILGRFTEERKAVLDAIREDLRRRDLTPLLFDFDKPTNKDVTGTVETLARMARFVIADLTDPSSIPHELATIVPFLRTTPVLPLRLVGTGGYSMFDDLRAYPWVLETYEYDNAGSLLSALSKVIAPANEMAERLRKTP